MGKPVIYNPNAPKGSRWSNAGLGTSTIARLYHSSAILLPDGSVLIAGSNPNAAYNNTNIYPTEYRAERFYPLYFGASRPKPSGIPSTLTYGGTPFDVTLDKSSYTGDSNAAAANTTVMLIRPGWTTHGMNMGQRSLQLNNTYTVDNNGTITLHVSQVPPNANLLTPGPVLFFVAVSGIPSNGTMVIVGSGLIETQKMLEVVALPDPVKATASSSGSGSGGSTGSGSPTQSSGSLSKGVLYGIIGGGVVLVLIIGTLIFGCIRRRSPKNVDGAAAAGMGATPPGMATYKDDAVGRDSTAFIPLQQYNNSEWNVANTPGSSQVDLHGGPGGYSDTAPSTLPAGQRGGYDEYYDSSPGPGGHAQFHGQDAQYPQYNDGPPQPYHHDQQTGRAS